VVPEELKVTGSPAVTISSASAKADQATIGAPALFRQSAQWQSAECCGAPLTL
jgi:hypothetical protein